jgi:hypothetical protein
LTRVGYKHKPDCRHCVELAERNKKRVHGPDCTHCQAVRAMMLNQSAERRARAAEEARNRVHGPDCKHCQFMKNQPAERRAQTSEYHKGRKHGPDCKHCERMRNQSTEDRARSSERHKGNQYNKGRIPSAESRRKMSESRTLPPDRERDARRVLSKVGADTNGCWPWNGSLDTHGYGQIKIQGKMHLAHRWVYTFYRGPIPEGLVLDHLCRVPRCENPEHLEPVTHQENCIRGIGPAKSRKSHCPRGHPYTPENSYLVKDGSRECRTCRRARSKKGKP